MKAPVASHSRLSEEQVATFDREGYLIYREPVLPADEFAALKNHFEGILGNLAPGQRPEAMDKPHFTDTTLFRWLFSDHILDLVEPILGPDIALFSSHFICKPKGDGKRVPWHEDSYYWKDMFTPMQVVTVWLAIDPSTPENGCMQVIPRTHTFGYSEYEPVDTVKNVFHIEIKPHQIDKSKAVSIVLDPNQASLHESKLMHSSAPNTSQKRRCGYTMRYISTRTKFARPEWMQIYLARGKDHAGNVYGDPTKTYEHLRAFKTNNNGH